MTSAPHACCAVIALMMALCSSVPAQTQTRSTTVYRCGPEGRDLRDAPCPDAPRVGASRVEFDQPSPAQMQAARAQTIAEAKQAHAMEQARLKQEAQAYRRAGRATGINGLALPPAAAASAAKAKPAKPPKPHKSSKPRPPGRAASSSG